MTQEQRTGQTHKKLRDLADVNFSRTDDPERGSQTLSICHALRPKIPQLPKPSLPLASSS